MVSPGLEGVEMAFRDGTVETTALAPSCRAPVGLDEKDGDDPVALVLIGYGFADERRGDDGRRGGLARADLLHQGFVVEGGAPLFEHSPRPQEKGFVHCSAR